MNFVIRTEEDKSRLISAIRAANWSMKVHVEPLFPKAHPNQYKYLFGVVYARIAEYVGETTVWQVHEDMMLLFNVEYSPLPDGMWEFRRKRGSEFTTISIAQYIERICAYWIVEHGLNIEEAHEVFANE